MSKRCALLICVTGAVAVAVPAVDVPGARDARAAEFADQHRSKVQCRR